MDEGGRQGEIGEEGKNGGRDTHPHNNGDTNTHTRHADFASEPVVSWPSALKAISFSSGATVVWQGSLTGA